MKKKREIDQEALKIYRESNPNLAIKNVPIRTSTHKTVTFQTSNSNPNKFNIFTSKQKKKRKTLNNKIREKETKILLFIVMNNSLVF